MRQAKEEKKKILLPNSVQTRLGQENSEKNSKIIEKIKKLLSDTIFSQNGTRKAEKERKKILPPNSVHTRPRLENFEKKSKQIEKIKKPLSEFIFSLNGMRQAEKEKKKIFFRIPFVLDSGKKIPKKIANKLKKLKNLFPTLFLAKTG